MLKWWWPGGLSLLRGGLKKINKLMMAKRISDKTRKIGKYLDCGGLKEVVGNFISRSIKGAPFALFFCCCSVVCKQPVRQVEGKPCSFEVALSIVITWHVIISQEFLHKSNYLLGSISFRLLMQKTNMSTTSSLEMLLPFLKKNNLKRGSTLPPRKRVSL